MVSRLVEQNNHSSSEHKTSVADFDHLHQIQSHILLSELPEPPIPLSEIGPIPPPPMFSTPSPTNVGGRPHILQSNSSNITTKSFLHPTDYNQCDFGDDDDSDLYRYPDDFEDEFITQQNINTMRIEEIPIREPVLNAVPKKSALKKKSSSGSSTPSNQETLSRPLIVRQENSSNSG